MIKEEIKFTSTIIENLKWVWKIWRQYKLMLFILISFGILSGFAIAAGPYVLKIIIDKIAELIKKDPKLLLGERREFLMYILGIGILQFLANLYPGFRGVMNHMLEYKIRSSVFMKLMDKTHAFFMKYRSGDIITRLTDDLSDFPKVAWFLCSGIFRAFNAVCVVLGSAILMLSIHVGLTVCALLTLPFCGGIFAAFHGKIKAAFEAKQKAVSNTNSYLESCLSGIDIIKAYNASERENIRFRKLIDERIEIETEVVKINSFFSSFFPNISFFGQLLVVAFGGWLTIKGSITIGDFFAFFTYLSFISFYAIDMAMFLISGRQAMVSIHRLREIIEDPRVFPHHSDTIMLEKGLIDRIELKDLTVKLDEALEPQISGIDFDFAPGRWIALVGPVGSGKSTLLNVLAGTVSPDSGTIKVNDTELHRINRKDYAGHLGFVGSEPVVFSTSLSNNIKFFRDIDEKDVKWAANISQFHDEVKDFSDGYEQKIGERGILLSGGQKQRLAIARALAQKPSLLLLDDVTSSLDADNEAKFLDTIEKELEGLTCVYATHRLKAAQKAHEIICLDDGMIVGRGDHKHLMDNCETYRKLVEAHMIDD